MAITRTQTQHTSTRQADVASTTVTHEGLVLSEPYSSEERIMSDVWDIGTFVKVWNPEQQRPERFCLGWYNDHGREATSEVDATPEVLEAFAAYEARQAAEKAEREAAYREAERQAEHDRPARGKIMQVVRGRKIPKGTVGEVVLTGEGQYGPYAMLATTARKLDNGRFADVVFINPAYLVNAKPLEG